MNLNLDIFKINSNNVTPKIGRILIAEPFLNGSYFNRSIVFLVEHNDKGSVGFILNKPVDFPIIDFKNELPNYNEKLYIGGPVNIDSLHFLHTLGELIPDSIKVKDNLYWGGDFNHLKSILNSDNSKANQVRFFLGYSGWDKSQLNEELEEDSWLVADISTEMVINSDKQLWRKMVKKQGGKYRLWENFPKNPSMN